MNRKRKTKKFDRFYMFLFGAIFILSGLFGASWQGYRGLISHEKEKLALYIILLLWSYPFVIIFFGYILKKVYEREAKGLVEGIKLATRKLKIDQLQNLTSEQQNTPEAISNNSPALKFKMRDEKQERIVDL